LQSFSEEQFVWIAMLVKQPIEDAHHVDREDEFKR
jgi:hypothetical protein